MSALMVETPNGIAMDTKFHSFKQCQFKNDGKWIDCEVNWHYMNKSIDIIYDNEQTKTKAIFDSIFIQSASLYIETADDSQLYEFRNVDLLPMIDEIIKNGLLPKCTWVVPLMYQAASDDAKIWNTFNEWMINQYEAEKADNNANNAWKCLTESVKDKLKATEILSDSIKSISRRHKKLNQLITKEEEQVLTDDAKEYIKEVKQASDELWDLCLVINSFAGHLSMESKLNALRIKKWKELKNIDSNDTKSDLYQSIKKGIEQIIVFGSNDKMQKLVININERIASVKQKFVRLENDYERLQTIDDEKESGISMSTKIGLGLFLTGAISGATVAGIALAVVVSTVIASCPVTWVVAGAVVAGIGIIGGIAFGAKMIHEKNKNRKIKKKNEQIEKCKQKFKELSKIVKDSKKECLLIQRAMNQLSNIIEDREKVSRSEDVFDMESEDALDMLDDTFSRCITQCVELQKVLNNTQNDVIDNEKEISDEKKVQIWLEKTVKLAQYFELFRKDGWDDLETIKTDLTMDNLIEMGIDKTGHRKKIIKYAAKLNVS